ncbi:MAG: UDP-N-acetylmuramate dehydrogenase [Prevotella sp.]|nr:UDP-N-acetylmuramate dehydrogenase [Prevotella sp.]
MRDIKNFDLLHHNTFGIDATCDRFIEIESEEEASHFFASLPQDERDNLLIIGGGSNVLFTGDYHGTVIRSAIRGTKSLDEGDTVLLRCGSGEQWDDIVDLCVKNNWYGAENLSLIPGDVGASAVQNIGAYGAEVKDLIVSIEAIDTNDGKPHIIPAKECNYGYRSSKFKDEWKNRFFITSVTYRLSKAFHPNLDYGNLRQQLLAKNIDHPTASQLRQTVIEVRREKLPDPKVLGNAGSFFVNPVVERKKYLQLSAQYPNMPHYTIDEQHEKIPAGWMIEQCGWKGRSLGNAAVHHRQALVLVNKGGATGTEVLALCERIREEVFLQFGIKISPEVNVV